jgi:hypothetical protein
VRGKQQTKGNTLRQRVNGLTQQKDNQREKHMSQRRLLQRMRDEKQRGKLLRLDPKEIQHNSQQQTKDSTERQRANGLIKESSQQKTRELTESNQAERLEN